MRAPSSTGCRIRIAKDYVDWIKESKREETRRRRIGKAVEMIRQGKPQR
jgi:uncharacterized protein YdeI (YjbR/CyaY-like superfamily)